MSRKIDLISYEATPVDNDFLRICDERFDLFVRVNVLIDLTAREKQLYVVAPSRRFIVDLLFDFTKARTRLDFRRSPEIDHRGGECRARRVLHAERGSK